MIFRRRKPPHEIIDDPEVRVWLERVTAKRRHVRRNTAIGVVVGISAVVVKLIATAVGVELFQHPTWILATVFGTICVVGIALAVRASRGSDA